MTSYYITLPLQGGVLQWPETHTILQTGPDISQKTETRRGEAAGERIHAGERESKTQGTDKRERTEYCYQYKQHTTS